MAPDASGAKLVKQAQQGLIRAAWDVDLSQLKSFDKPKIIHDPVWGTCEYESWEVSLLELPVFQRLRGLRQTGFANLTYPAAEHSRFQHTLGVIEAASRLFDSVVKESGKGLSPQGIATRKKPAVLVSGRNPLKRRWRMLVRLAAMVHDLGHSVFSHTSERIFSLIPPFPDLVKYLGSKQAKPPGAAEVAVFLLVTSPEWHAAVKKLWPKSSSGPIPPSAAEWKRIGRWVMGQEDDPELKFLADIISGPVDADKLDYVFRDGYVAGIPIGYDLERLTSTVCVDPQRNADTGVTWWRLTVPIKGINALEQLVMGRLVLNSYLYHHQKCRAAETAFERVLAREYLRRQTVLGTGDVWKLFDMQDGDVLAFARTAGPDAREVKRLLERRLRVRVVEFRFRDLEEKTEDSSQSFKDLLGLVHIREWGDYRRLVALEDKIARLAGLPRGSVILDIPKQPDYADLENLLLPGRNAQEQESPTKVLNYRDWIAAYKVHRAWVRVFAPRGRSEDAVWSAARTVFASMALRLPNSARVTH